MLRNNADAHISSLAYLWAYQPLPYPQRVLGVSHGRIHGRSHVGSASFAVVLIRTRSGGKENSAKHLKIRCYPLFCVFELFSNSLSKLTENLREELHLSLA